MSTDNAAAVGAGSAEGHGLRLMTAVVLATVAGMIYGDLLVTFLAPVFVTMFAAPDAPAPPLKRAVVLALLVWLIAAIAGEVAAFFSGHTDVLVLLFAAFILLCFRRDALVGPTPTIGLVLVMGVVAGTMSASAAPVAQQLIEALPVAVLASMFAIMIAHAIVPHRGGLGAYQTEPMATSDQPLRDAIVRTLILLPLVIGYLVAGKTDGFYILITAIAVLRVPQPEHAAIGLIAANVLGGAIALFAAMLIFMVPSPLFGLIILAILALSLGLLVEHGGKRGMLAHAAAGPAIIMLMLALAPLDGSEVYFTRVVEIIATVIYVLLAQTLLGTVTRQPARESGSNLA